MNAEHLHTVAKKMTNDFAKYKIIKLLSVVVNSFKGKLADPNNPSLQQSLEAQIATLIDALLNLENNYFPSNWLTIVDEIGGSEFIGKNLANETESIISKNNLTPSVAHQTFSSILERFNSFNAALASLLTTFKILKIPTEEIELGIAEVGVIIPRKEIENSLQKFGKEILEINKIFGVFYEIVTGSRESIKIRKISSSDLTIFLEFAPEVAAFTALAIERIINLYKNSLEIKLLKIELQEKGVPKNDLQSIDIYSNSIMENGINQLIEEIEQKYISNKDDARRNEIRVEIKHALFKLAERIDKGYKIDIRIEPYIGNGTIDDEQEKNTTNAIIESSKKIQYDSFLGSKILNLPKPPQNNSDESKD